MSYTLNKITIPIILSVAVVIAGVFAFMPVEKASTVHFGLVSALGPITTLSLEKTLSTSGADVSWTLTAESDVLVLGMYHDNTPTLDAELCDLVPSGFNFGGHHQLSSNAIHCEAATYRSLNLEIDGSQYNEVRGPHEFNTHLKVIEGMDKRGNIPTNNIPLEAGQSLVVTFDTTNSSNDVKLDVSFSIRGVADLE